MESRILDTIEQRRRTANEERQNTNIGLINNFERNRMDNVQRPGRDHILGRLRARNSELIRRISTQRGPHSRNLMNMFGNFDSIGDPQDDFFRDFPGRLLSRNHFLGIKRNKFKKSEESELTIKKVLEKNKEFFDHDNIKKVREKKHSKKIKEEQQGEGGVCAKRIHQEVRKES